MTNRSPMDNRSHLRVASDPMDAPTLVRPSVRVRSAAERLDMDASQVRKLVREGKIEGHLIGKHGVRIYVDSIEAYQRARPTGGRAQPTESPTPRKTRRKSAAHFEAVAYLNRLGLVSRR